MSAFPYERLEHFDKIVIEYAGSNDEGSINDITAVPLPEGVELADELYHEIEQAAYDLLEDHYGGWEINEGSHGEITVYPKDKRVLLHHGEIIESTNWIDKELIGQ